MLNIVRLSAVTDCFFFVELFRELDGVFSADEPFAGPKIQRQNLQLNVLQEIVTFCT